MIEILAPAGNMQCLYAAVQAGANAVYIGAGEFSARKDAGFSLSAVGESVKYAHSKNVKIYAALNILLFNRELSQAVQLCQNYADIGVDGIIVQDMGLVKVLHEQVPRAVLHASTQCAVYDKYGAEAAKKAGFSRVVLAREMSLEQIREVTKSVDIETEVFVHGALCSSVSGLCGMSVSFSGIDGKNKRSGNRGTCAQPCRLNFKAGTREYALSLEDLSLLKRWLGGLGPNMRFEGQERFI
jgi:putative protease